MAYAGMHEMVAHHGVIRIQGPVTTNRCPKSTAWKKTESGYTIFSSVIRRPLNACNNARVHVVFAGIPVYQQKYDFMRAPIEFKRSEEDAFPEAVDAITSPSHLMKE